MSPARRAVTLARWAGWNGIWARRVLAMALDPFSWESQAREAEIVGGSGKETGSHREPKMAFPFLTAQSEKKQRGEQSALSFAARRPDGRERASPRQCCLSSLL